ncbi:unnamed protein product [Prunus armeniaca]
MSVYYAPMKVEGSNTGVVPVEGSPMLKSAMSDKFARVTGSENGSIAQSFDVGLCVSCCGGDTFCEAKVSLFSVGYSRGYNLVLRAEPSAGVEVSNISRPPSFRTLLVVRQEASFIVRMVLAVRQDCYEPSSPYCEPICLCVIVNK